MKLTKSDITLCEKDALQDMLDSEKALISLYATALYEGSGKNIRKNFADNLNAVAENQYTLFQQMSARGYYEVPPAKKDMIDQANETFKKQQKTLKCAACNEN
ncbi:MAG: spore coat protein [Clostridia bacterium]|nr:spore coat protein [Clostridia bacterium]